MIIGLTGTFASGKDTVADYLVKNNGYTSMGTGDIVREYVKKRNIPNSRDAQREMGNSLRKEFGNDFLVKVVISRLKGENKVITGIRQPFEADFFKNKQDTILIAVDAPIEQRFARIKERNREGDPKSILELKEKEAKEMQGKGKNCQNISYCMKAADYKIINDGSYEDLYKKIDNILGHARNV